jgi:hypothetical protein
LLADAERDWMQPRTRASRQHYSFVCHGAIRWRMVRSVSIE